jgi:hypothetical protein
MKKFLNYAFGETMVIIFGVLIALQVSNWNENRQLRQVEQLLLKGLHLEMKDNVEQLNEAMHYHTISRDAANLMLMFYNGDKKYSRHEVIDSTLSNLQWAWTYNPSIGALNSIKTSGHLNSVRNSALRNLITKYEDLYLDAQEESKIIQDMIINQYIPSVNKYVSFSQKAKYLGKDYEVGESAFPPDYEGLFRDRDLESLISYIYAWRIDEKKEETKLSEMMQEFIRILEKELE